MRRGRRSHAPARRASPSPPSADDRPRPENARCARGARIPPEGARAAPPRWRLRRCCRSRARWPAARCAARAPGSGRTCGRRGLRASFRAHRSNHDARGPDVDFVARANLDRIGHAATIQKRPVAALEILDENDAVVALESRVTAAYLRVAQRDLRPLVASEFERRAPLERAVCAAFENVEPQEHRRDAADLRRGARRQSGGEPRDERERRGDLQRADSHLPREVDGGRDLERHAVSNLIFVSPKSSSSPSRSGCERTRRPFTYVPLVDPTSRTTGSPPRISTTACERETLGSTRTISLSSLRPIRAFSWIEYTPSGGTPLTMRKQNLTRSSAASPTSIAIAPSGTLGRAAIVTRASPSSKAMPTRAARSRSRSAHARSKYSLCSARRSKSSGL